MQSWMLSVIQSRRQPTFLRLGMGNLEWLVDAGYILMVWLMAMAMAVGTWGVSRIPKFVPPKKPAKPL